MNDAQAALAAGRRAATRHHRGRDRGAADGLRAQHAGRAARRVPAGRRRAPPVAGRARDAARLTTPHDPGGHSTRTRRRAGFCSRRRASTSTWVAWRRLRLYAGAFGAPAPHVSVAQLPFVSGEDWVGRSPPTASRTSLLLVSGERPDRATPIPPRRGAACCSISGPSWCPSGKAETGAGVPLRQPERRGAAGDPDGDALRASRAAGTSPSCSSIVNETMDLAQIRPGRQ